MATREERIVTLASTLKSSGLAKSDAQARMMAEEMVGVEDHVQKKFDEEHSKAQEFLRTTKNLGQPRKVEEQKPMTPIAPIERPKPIEQMQRPVQRIEPIRTETLVSSKPVSQMSEEHNTHNSVIESIKQQIQQDFEDNDPVLPADPSAGNAPTIISEDNDPFTDVVSDATHVEDAYIGPGVSEAMADPNSNAMNQPSEEPSEPQGLDSKRLVELMEEDGALEETTREIKEKPKNVKPKEEYAENSIDLSSMFNVHK
jgi:hypothetical protein